MGDAPPSLHLWIFWRKNIWRILGISPLPLIRQTVLTSSLKWLSLKNIVFIFKILPDWSFQGKAVGWNSVSYKIIISSGFKKGLTWDDIFGHYTFEVRLWWRILSNNNFWVIPSSIMCNIISKIGHMLPKCFSANYWGTMTNTNMQGKKNGWFLNTSLISFCSDM